MTNSNSRLEYIKNYFDSNLVKVEVPLQTIVNYRGQKVIHRFNDIRMGYKFTNNIAYVEKADLHKFRNQHYIIHESNN